MQPHPKIKILFIAGFGPVVADPPASRRLYQEVLKIPFKEEQGGYLHTGAVAGAKHFALWPLAHAAQSIFGSGKWPADVPTPQGWVEFDVEDIESATAALEEHGYQMLVRNKVEPWGQTVTRFLSPEGLLVGITVTPVMREEE